MKKVRESLFETNSSSTHSLTISKVEEFESWERGELLYDSTNYKFIPSSETEFSKEKYYSYIRDKTHVLTNGIVFKNVFYKSLDDIPIYDVISSDELQKHYNTTGGITYQEWVELDGFEKFQYKCTTPGGENIMVFGEYGRMI